METTTKPECVYCKTSTKDCPPSAPAFTCSNCSYSIHPGCLRKGPPQGTLLGDAFYHVTCTKCCKSDIEVITRPKLPWLDIILISLYNMALDKDIPSKNGYFHYKRQIAASVSKNWVISLSSVLSSFSPALFASGTKELKELGWWKLARLAPPAELLAAKRQTQAGHAQMPTGPISRYPGTRKKKKESQENVAVEAVVDSEDSLSSNSIWTPAPSVMEDEDSNETSVSTSTASNKGKAKEEWLTAEGLKVSETVPEHLFTDNDSPVDYEIEVDDGFAIHEELSLDITNFAIKKSECVVPIADEVKEIKEEEEKELVKKVKRKKKEEDHKTKLVQMSVYEEQVLLRKLETLNHAGKLNPEGYRLRRKLILRKNCRTSGRAVFNFDNVISKQKGGLLNDSSAGQISRSSEQRVLDRFYGGIHHVTEYQRKSTSFKVKLIGGESTPQSFVSPYTGRSLKPFIRRDFESKPLKAKLLEAIRQRGLEKGFLDSLPSAIPVDYCYVQPQHIPAVNALCREFFWPGIDLREVLQYPDFSCVVLYRKVVVAFAFMVPDVCYNEAYISFIFTHPDWRGAGIAKFMLYHLIQTGMGKDITLHVSATNQALILYQRFGFKVEEFITDFFDKYLPADSNQCKHALLMRLCR